MQLAPIKTYVRNPRIISLPECAIMFINIFKCFLIGGRWYKLKYLVNSLKIHTSFEYKIQLVQCVLKPDEFKLN